MMGDPIKLSWVVSNLIGNALRYTPSGGTIMVCAQRWEDGVRLRVRDNGPGIAPQIRDTCSNASRNGAPTVSRPARAAWV